MSDLLAQSKALLELDADGALVPHGLGGHGRKCLTWCVSEVERLRAMNERPQLRTAQLGDALTMLLHMLSVIQAGGKISPEDESCLDDLILEIRRSRL
jgi:hypothetical protein